MKLPRRGPALVALTLALLAGAFLVRATQPSDDQQELPFVTTAEFGERAEGREHRARNAAHGAKRTHEQHGMCRPLAPGHRAQQLLGSASGGWVLQVPRP